MDTLRAEPDRLRAVSLAQTIPSPVQHQVTTVTCSTDQAGYAVGGAEGRTAIRYFDPARDKPKAERGLAFAFKCHRRQDMCYPVNGIAFHPNPSFTDVFVTVGADGTWLC